MTKGNRITPGSGAWKLDLARAETTFSHATLLRLSQSPHWRVRAACSRNRLCPPSLLARLRQDPCWQVREVAERSALNDRS